jgi:hypothetical protein
MGYYQAGGLFSRFSFKKLGRFVGSATKAVSGIVAKAAPVVTAFNPALGVGLSSIGSIGGRIGGMLSPQAAPSGMPMEGTPPFAPVQSALTFNSMPPVHLTPGHRQRRQRRTRSRGRRRSRHAMMA